MVTGGFGFIGSHTVRALLDLGEDCGIVHLTGSCHWPLVPAAPVEATRQALDGLLNIAVAAQGWGAPRADLMARVGRAAVGQGDARARGPRARSMGCSTGAAGPRQRESAALASYW